MIDDFANPPTRRESPSYEGMLWRAYERGRDAAPLAALFRAAIQTLAASRYDAAQRNAWAAVADDVEAFDARLARGVTLVAEATGAVSCAASREYAAFGQLFPCDHVEMLYVAPAWKGRGLATALIARFEALAREARAITLDTDASALARPVFERAGFSLVAQEWVRRGSVSLPRFHLCKPLDAESLAVSLSG
ncbi:GNAT family N-acetyltransferase [Paraburkholderia sp. Ac-20340]|uniref:GNAT family N-acetyltransferase n=1 Tax=Paraburkholderia sp. Ac-20340 TaxID=2703888 RepID=UPI001F120AC8|nr:GNAT family N-acetyltransferase [Paraburkholderia sp. Ac-20340]